MNRDNCIQWRRLPATLVLAVALVAAGAARAEEPETVVLLHGYGRTERSMRPLEESLRADGFTVHSFTYPSMRSTPEELTAFLDGKLKECCSTAPRVHFVTHSLGGIVVRAYLAGHDLPNLGKVVMLAPPNHGSEVADWINRFRALRALVGPTAVQLGTEAGSLPNRLPRPDFELGVIAAIDESNPVGDLFVPEPSDGTVSVASTEIEGMRDFLTVRRSHTFVMRAPEVANYVTWFLRTGCFE
jgi:pimeloyl-ACP methyl ester carboxylesterase